MSKSAYIENGVVTNVIVGTMDNHVPCEDEVGIDWHYDGARFTPPPELPLTQDEQISQVDIERDERIAQGFVFTGHRHGASQSN
ncbi:MAG: hypothetical protein AAF442_00005 [Pseudomonadota bacterium]